ncbi:MAG: o-succinylbenzoate--CoA ligase [Chlorobiaceae bacterium]|nr:o-succinylbenzoate--CoA ligase [Chlorobiaceae bacterium]
MDIVANAAKVFGNRPALITDERIVSFTDLDKKTALIASAFTEEGITAGDIVVLVAPNSESMLLALLALMRMGAIAAPVNYRFPENQTAGILQRLNPSMTLGKTALERFIGEAQKRNKSGFKPASAMKRPVSIIHTSASSGQPKAAMHTLSNHWHSAMGSAENLPFGPEECWLLSLPLYHVGGYSMLFKCLLGGGALAVASPESSLSESLERFPVTHLSLVPTQLYRMLRSPGGAACLKQLKALLLGGSAVNENLLCEAIGEKLPLRLTYGSTEMSTQVSTSSAPVTSPTADSGTLLPYREAMIAPDGEILVKGPCLFIGYLDDVRLRSARDTRGWFHTGDMGSISEQGLLTVLGRKDNMFISGGENIHPEEIEKALCSIDGIEEAVVVPAPDAEYGMRPVAWIRVEGNKEPTDDFITENLRKSIGKLKTPVRFTRVTEWVTIPGSAKIDRNWYMKKVTGDQ